ncbi:hypothetical protein BOTBODRAFT_181399 [Botryobasidium botryosum FD-172 SS1]|uniref:Uncharacterized protein n=1 Tax=Botryobasidium botryosum (strain FD-172 SS1) TaxID=930990 RepID=A0A067M4X2_BOTB1|nr:hypothetical protein BOTBODRAFT_181399 [Botryobasidium botryosum FD-172 SS1]
MSTAASNNPFRNQQTQPPRESSPTIPDDDAPPPYSAAPNQRAGEAAIEYGPRRPFQPVDPQRQPRPPPLINFQPPGQPNVPVQHTGWGQYPGQGQQQMNNWVPHPPPRHPSVSGQHSLHPRPSSVGSSPSQQSPTRDSRTTSPSSQGPPNDGRPTVSPTPGHPLMLNGRVLVYPRGFQCPKCYNFGFKRLDPTHPCQKCWSRYAKPFSGPIVHADWSQTAGSTFQRPLPAHSRPPPSSPFGSVNLSRAASTSAIPSPPIHPQVAYAHGPPPNALVVQPGDPRIGGRQCWDCGGRGTVSYLIFDSETCRTCRGMGRVFA